MWLNAAYRMEGNNWVILTVPRGFLAPQTSSLSCNPPSIRVTTFLFHVSFFVPSFNYKPDPATITIAIKLIIYIYRWGLPCPLKKWGMNPTYLAKLWPFNFQTHLLSFANTMERGFIEEIHILILTFGRS